MSEDTLWMIIALIAAVVLSSGWVMIRKRQRLRRPSSTAGAPEADSFQRKHPLLLGVMAVIIAGLAQYALQQNQPVFAALGYWMAVVLFVSALRQFAPVTMLSEVPASTAPSNKKRPRSKFGGISLGLTALSHKPQADLALERIAIGSAAAVSVEKLTVAPAAVQVWVGFERPQGLGITANGNVLVFDGARQRVYCLNSLGAMIQEWSLPEIPPLQDYSAAFSPDGQKLYLTDPTQGQVYAVTFTKDRL